MTSAQAQDMRAEINRRLLEGGELERLERDLLHLLQESGWQENLKNSCRERMRDRDPARRARSFGELFNAVQDEAAESVPESVKIRIVERVLAVLREMVE